jgi:hypothetical protein
MLDYVAPFGLAELIRSLVSLLPHEAFPLSFGLVLAGYLAMAARIFRAVAGRADFMLATLLRRHGRPPLEIQHMLAPVAIRAPSWADRAAWTVLVLSSVHWLQLLIAPEPRILFEILRRIIDLLWG